MTDYIYFALVGIAILVWLAATVLYIDKLYRRRKWRRQDDERRAYQQFIGSERELLR